MRRDEDVPGKKIRQWRRETLYFGDMEVVRKVLNRRAIKWWLLLSVVISGVLYLIYLGNTRDYPAARNAIAKNSNPGSLISDSLAPPNSGTRVPQPSSAETARNDIRRDEPPSSPPTLPADFIAKLGQAYAEHDAESQAAHMQLKDYLKENPANARLHEVRWIEAAAPVRPIVLAHAFASPELRRMLLDMLQDPKQFLAFRDYFASGLDVSGVNYSAATTPEILAELIVQSEPGWQARFEEVLTELNIPDETGHLIAKANGSGNIREIIGGYMERHGFVYDIASKRFTPKDKSPQKH